MAAVTAPSSLAAEAARLDGKVSHEATSRLKSFGSGGTTYSMLIGTSAARCPD